MAKKDKSADLAKKDTGDSDLVKKFKQNPAVFIGTVIVLVLIVVSFVVIPAIVPNSGGGSDNLVFGYYDRIPIEYVPGNAFARFYRQVLDFFQSQGAPLDDFQVSVQLWMQTYELAVVHTAILQMSRRSNYVVPQNIVDRRVAQLPQFQENGRFSPSLYNQHSEAARLAVWQQTQEELIRWAYFDSFFGLLVPEAEANFIAGMSAPMRSFDMVTLSIDEYPASEFRAYAEQNSRLFDSIHMSRITLYSSERDARRVLDSILNGTITFEEAARSQSQDSYADRGGDMGSRYYFEFDLDIPNIADRQAIFSLPRGTISDIYFSNNGWSFYRIEDDVTPPDFNDEAVMERVRLYVRGYERGRMENWAIDRAREFIAEAQAAGFEEAADLWGMEIHSFGPFPINYEAFPLFNSLEDFTIGDFTADQIQSLSRNDNFWRNVFSAEINSPAEPLVQGSNILVFNPVEEIEADEEALLQIASDYGYYLENFVYEQSLQGYFVTDNMYDQFWESYFRIFF